MEVHQAILNLKAEGNRILQFLLIVRLEIKHFLTSQTGKKGFLAIADQAVYGATTFLTTVIIARAAGNEQLGLYAIGLSLAFVAMSLQNTLILLPYIVYGARLRGDAKSKYTGSVLIHSLSLSGFSMAAFMLLLYIFASGVGPAGLDSVCWALVVVIPFILLRQYVRMLSFADLRIGTALSVDLSVGLLQIGGLLVLAHFSVLSSAFRAFCIIGAACGLSTGYWFLKHKGKFTVNFSQVLFDFRRNWKFSKWLATTMPVANLRVQLVPWFLTFFHGPGSTGLFAACISISSMANPFLNGIGNLIGPKAAHSYAQGGLSSLRKFVLKVYIPIGMVMAVFCLAILLFGGRFVTLAYGDDYANLGTIVSLLAAGIFVSALCLPARRGLLALKNSRAIFVSEFIPFILHISLGLWLIMRFSIWGAAFGILLGYIVEAVSLGTISARQFTTSEEDTKKLPFLATQANGQVEE